VREFPPIEIRLSKARRAEAFAVSDARQRMNQSYGVKPAYGAPTDPEKASHISRVGCAGELAVCRAFHYDYGDGNLGDYKAPDAGQLQVRTSERDTYGGRPTELILHPDDNDDDVFIHVTGCPYPRIMLLQGWIYAREGKKEEYWKDPTGKNRPAFFVPRHVLKDIVHLYWLLNPVDTPLPK
jgi:hypothetical protein